MKRERVLTLAGEVSLERFRAEGGSALTPHSPSEGYYDALPIGSELQYPDVLDRAFSAYAGLSDELRKSFDRAAFLFLQGEHLRRSNFAPLSSYASAIESLLDKGSEPCPICGQDRHRLSSKFFSFMKQHAPVVMSKALQAKMYGARSKEVHGSFVSLIDEDQFGPFDINYQLFPWQVRKALVNWLLDHAPR